MPLSLSDFLDHLKNVYMQTSHWDDRERERDRILKFSECKENKKSTTIENVYIEQQKKKK